MVENDDAEVPIPSAAGARAPSRKIGAADRTRILGGVRWVVGRLMGMGLDWRDNIGLNDERLGPLPPVVRIAINWREIATTPSYKTRDGMRRLVARQVAQGLAEVAEEYTGFGKDPTFPTWHRQFVDIDQAVRSLEQVIVDGIDKDDFWAKFMADLQAVYPQLERYAGEEFKRRNGISIGEALEMYIGRTKGGSDAG